MKWSYKILRAILVSLLTLVILIPTTLYVVMTIPPVQNKVKEINILLDSMYLFLKELESQYPDNVKITELEV